MTTVARDVSSVLSPANRSELLNWTNGLEGSSPTNEIFFDSTPSALSTRTSTWTPPVEPGVRKSATFVRYFAFASSPERTSLRLEPCALTPSSKTKASTWSPTEPAPEGVYVLPVTTSGSAGERSSVSGVTST